LALKPARLQWSEDGTLLSLDYGDIYFQRGQGMAESGHVFLKGNGLGERFRNLGDGVFRIAELGLGSGLNFLLTAQPF
jgi:tRNA 5-methylaminomethyl-2-thiouridine biosynthesis bifunctional protein